MDCTTSLEENYSFKSFIQFSLTKDRQVCLFFTPMENPLALVIWRNMCCHGDLSWSVSHRLWSTNDEEKFLSALQLLDNPTVSQASFIYHPITFLLHFPALWMPRGTMLPFPSTLLLRQTSGSEEETHDRQWRYGYVRVVLRWSS